MHDTGRWRPQRGGRVNRRLAPADERAIDELELFNAVSRTAELERLEIGDVMLVAGDDELAAARVRNAVPSAELVQQVAALDAEPRLERAGRIVDAGMNHTAVVCARVQTSARMSFDDARGIALGGDSPGRGKAGHAGSDNRYIDAFHNF